MVMLEKNLSLTMNAKLICSGTDSSTDSDVIILAHGFGADQSVWDMILPDLTNRHRVMVFDWSFSGVVTEKHELDPVKCSSYESFADELICLVDEMKLTSSVFVGHSMAGMIGCIASIKRPELFKKLILIGASPRYMNAKDYTGGFEKEQIDSIISNIELNYQNWAPNFASLVVGSSNDPISIAIFEKSLKRMKPEVAFHVGKMVFLCDERDQLEKITVPCTIIQTTNDIVVPSSVPEFMLEKIKGKSTVEIIETDGHFPQLTSHVKLLEVLDKDLVL